MVLDAPEHEDYTGNHREDKGIRKVAVEGELDNIASEAEGTSSLNQGTEHPPTDRAKR